MSIECAIFDFDGTLFDTMPIWDGLGEIYLRGLGKEPKGNVREDIRTLSLQQAAVYFQKEYDLPLSAEEVQDGINKTIESAYLHEVLPKPGVIGFLEQLKAAGIKMCVATASDRYQIEAALKRCSMDGFFDALFTCTEVGHGKDEPIIFREAMEHFGANRSNTIVFEDSIHAIQTAKADGFLVAGIYDPSEVRQSIIVEISDCYIKDFEDTEDFWKLASA